MRRRNVGGAGDGRLTRLNWFCRRNASSSARVDRSGAVRRAADCRHRRRPGAARLSRAQPGLRGERGADSADPPAGSRLSGRRSSGRPLSSACSTRFASLPGVVSVGITQNAFLRSSRTKPWSRSRTGRRRTISRTPCSFAASALITSGRCESRRSLDAYSPMTTPPDRPPVAIISRRFAETLMPGLDPIGRKLIRNIAPLVTELSASWTMLRTSPPRSRPSRPLRGVGAEQCLRCAGRFVIRTAVEPSSLLPAVGKP